MEAEPVPAAKKDAVPATAPIAHDATQNQTESSEEHVLAEKADNGDDSPAKQPVGEQEQSAGTAPTARQKWADIVSAEESEDNKARQIRAERSAQRAEARAAERKEREAVKTAMVVADKERISEETRAAEPKRQVREAEQEILKTKKASEKAERDRLANEARARAASEAKERTKGKATQEAADRKVEVQAENVSGAKKRQAKDAQDCTDEQAKRDEPADDDSQTRRTQVDGLAKSSGPVSDGLANPETEARTGKLYVEEKHGAHTTISTELVPVGSVESISAESTASRSNLDNEAGDTSDKPAMCKTQSVGLGTKPSLPNGPAAAT